METRTLTPRYGAGSALQTLERTQELGFPLRVVGESRAAVLPQRVGDWWMEPLNEGTVLPSRAQQRLDTLLATGVEVKSVVLFHEIADEPKQPGRYQQLVLRLHRWYDQELPVVLSNGAAAVRVAAPVLGKAVLVAGAVLLVVAAAPVILAVAAIGTAGAVDPCLVVVTKDGTWLEVDRWDN